MKDEDRNLTKEQSAVSQDESPSAENHEKEVSTKKDKAVSLENGVLSKSGETSIETDISPNDADKNHESHERASPKLNQHSEEAKPSKDSESTTVQVKQEPVSAEEQLAASVLKTQSADSNTAPEKVSKDDLIESAFCAGDGTTCIECGKTFSHPFYFR